MNSPKNSNNKDNNFENKNKNNKDNDFENKNKNKNKNNKDNDFENKNKNKNNKVNNFENKNKNIIELIIESPKSSDIFLISSIANIKYNLPIINSIVIEIDKSNIDKLKNMNIVKNFYDNASIHMQMNTARQDVKADIAQNLGYTGKSIGVAILDTGIANCNDFTRPSNRIIAFKDFINQKNLPYDDNGHGTHVTGIACGSGINSNGRYKGIAVNANIIGVKVLNADGQGNASDVLAGLQWVIDNKAKYNIKIINLSIGTSNTSTNDPLVKAVENAWDKGLIVNIAAGNNGPESCTISSPAISKKVITVGSSDDNKRTNVWGNNLVNFSGRGPTVDCVIKPDIVAPGVDIVSCSNKSNNLINTNSFNIFNIFAQNLYNNSINNNYIKLSGTSMSTPIVSGAIALLLEKNPDLKPDDVKLMLKMSCKNLNLPQNQQGWGMLDIYKLLSQEVRYAR